MLIIRFYNCMKLLYRIIHLLVRFQKETISKGSPEPTPALNKMMQMVLEPAFLHRTAYTHTHTVYSAVPVLVL